MKLYKFFKEKIKISFNIIQVRIFKLLKIINKFFYEFIIFIYVNISEPKKNFQKNLKITLKNQLRK